MWNRAQPKPWDPSITSDVDSLRDGAEVAGTVHRLVGRVLVLGLERAVIHRLVAQVLVLGLERAAVHALTACLLAARSSGASLPDNIWRR